MTSYFETPAFWARMRSLNAAMAEGMPFPVKNAEAALGCSLLEFVSYLRAVENEGVAYVPIGDDEVIAISDIASLEVCAKAFAEGRTPTIAERMAPYNDALASIEDLHEATRRPGTLNEFSGFIDQQERSSQKGFAAEAREQRRQRKRQREIERLNRKVN